MILVVGQNAAWQKVGTVETLHRGEVNRFRRLDCFASGKAPNVVRALAALGGGGEAVIYAGGRMGALVEESLAAEGVPCACCRMEGETRVCTTVAEADGSCTELIDPSPPVTESERAAMERMVAERLPRARLLVISGTAMPGEPDDCYARLISAARRQGTPTVLDSSGVHARRALAEGPEVLKVNARELGEIAGAPAGTLEERVDACRRVAAAHGVRWFLVTRGPEGVEAFDGRALLHAAPPRVAVVNAIGSGDAATAGVAWVIHGALARGGAATVFSSGEALEEALLCAAAMGTANCMNVVNGRVGREDYLSVRAGTTVTRLTVPSRRA